MSFSAQKGFLQNPSHKGAAVVAVSVVCSVASLPSVAPTYAQRCEERLGAAMLSLARAEGHAPAVASEVREAFDAGMTVNEIARCLGIHSSIVTCHLNRSRAASGLSDC